MSRRRRHDPRVRPDGTKAADGPAAVGLAAVFLAFLAAELAAAAGAATLEGRLTLVEDKGRDAAAEMRGAIVYFVPDAPVAIEPPAEPADVATVRKDFLPRVSAVVRGTTVRFPNEDPILHNVFSVSSRNRFDLGLVAKGEAGRVVLSEAGTVAIFCNVHHDMVAYVLVLETPFFATPQGDGRFRLEGLPDGPGTVTVWHERAEPWRTATTVPGATPLQVRLELTKPRIPPHNDKQGKPYRRRGRRY